MNPEKVEYIVDALSDLELLAQLAEEAAELGHAALKLRRAIDGGNPTPVTKAEAVKNLREEIADVWLLVKVLGMDEERDVATYREIMARKVDRWAKRMDWGSE